MKGQRIGKWIVSAHRCQLKCERAESARKPAKKQEVSKGLALTLKGSGFLRFYPIKGDETTGIQIDLSEQEVSKEDMVAVLIRQRLKADMPAVQSIADGDADAVNNDLS